MVFVQTLNESCDVPGTYVSVKFRDRTFSTMFLFYRYRIEFHIDTLCFAGRGTDILVPDTRTPDTLVLESDVNIKRE